MNKKLKMKLFTVALSAVCLTSGTAVVFGCTPSNIQTPVDQTLDSSLLNMPAGPMYLDAISYYKCFTLQYNGKKLVTASPGRDFYVEVFDSKTKKQIPAKDLKIELTIGGVPYPHVIKDADDNSGRFKVDVPYLKKSRARLELEDKKDPSKKLVYEFLIDEKPFLDAGDLVEYFRPYRIKGINENTMKMPEAVNYSYNPASGKYTFTMPANPMKPGLESKFKTWTVTYTQGTTTITKNLAPLEQVTLDVSSYITISPNGPMTEGKWEKLSDKWFYQFSDGTYAKNLTLEINGKTYKFCEKGEMVTGWDKTDGNWYYFDSTGAMVKNGWKEISGTWYYFYKDGKMAENTTVEGYYVNSSGAYVAAKWIKGSNGKWWYQFSNGTYPYNRMEKINGASYFFDEDGYMTVGWLYNGGKWYYFNTADKGTEGAMVTSSWKEVNGKWYYFYNDGTMAANTVVDGYRVDGSGAWIK